MAFGTGSQLDPSIKNVYAFQIKDKDLPAPVFHVQRKKEDGKYEKLPDANRVDGNLVGIRVKKFTHQNEEIVSVSATIKDPKAADLYYVSIPFTYLGRNLMNSLLNLSDLNNIEAALYKSKPKEGQQTGFSSCALRQGPTRDLIYGKYSKEQLPEIPKVMVRGKPQGDTLAIDNFFIEKINEFSAFVRSKVAAGAPADEGAPDGEEQAAPEPSTTPGVPF